MAEPPSANEAVQVRVAAAVAAAARPDDGGAADSVAVVVAADAEGRDRCRSLRSCGRSFPRYCCCPRRLPPASRTAPLGRAPAILAAHAARRLGLADARQAPAPIAARLHTTMHGNVVRSVGHSRQQQADVAVVHGKRVRWERVDVRGGVAAQTEEEEVRLFQEGRYRRGHENSASPRPQQRQCSLATGVAQRLASSCGPWTRGRAQAPRDPS